MTNLLVESTVKGQRFLKVTHSVVTIQAVDFASKSLDLFCEYHIRVSSTKPAEDLVSPTSRQAGKALGLAFLLPDGTVDVSAVQLNGKPVPGLSVHEDLQNISRFDAPSYWCFPQSADSAALGKIFARLCENRRDLISYEEISKAHSAASTGQSFGLLLKIPPVIDESPILSTSEPVSSLVAGIRITISGSPIFKKFQAEPETDILATLGNEVWFPIPSRIMVLPSGMSVTAQPMEHQRYKCTVKIGPSVSAGAIIVSGEQVAVNVFENSWINPRSVGLFISRGDNLSKMTGSVFQAICLGNESLMESTLKNVIPEIVQVLGPWFSSAGQIPQLNLVFLPLPVSKAFHVFGNTILMDSGILHGEGLVENKILARSLLAEAVAAVWVERALPAFAEPWLCVGLRTVLADRFVEFHLGQNEYNFRVISRRQRFHAMVERGLDWRPLSIISDSQDPLLKLKAPLVMDCLRRSITGDSDLRAALHELNTVASGKKGPWTSEAFFYLITCIVGQHTEAGKSISQFKQDWVLSVGVPVIHVGFSMLEKRKFALLVSQRPLQRINTYDNSSMCSTGGSSNNQKNSAGCACGSDYVGRKAELSGGATYMRNHLHWPGTARRRFWNGEIEVSIFRSTNYFVPVSVKMEDSSPDLAQQVLTVPYVTPRKHEQVLNRASRDDELVHGWIAVVDDKWLLAKIIVCQSPLMWCNQLNFSKNISMEHAAVEALQHVRGSALGQEALAVSLHGCSQEVFWRVRQEAGKALIHLALGCGEREAMLSVIAWLQSVVTARDLNRKIHPAEWLTWNSVAEQLALVRRNADRRDQESISELFAISVNSIEKALAIVPHRNQWRLDPAFLLSQAIRFALLSSVSETIKQSPAFAAIDSRLMSDMYGPPLSSADLMVTEAVLGAAQPKNYSSWNFLKDPKWLEKLSMNPVRRVSRTAIKAYLIGQIGNGEDHIGSWDSRFLWIEKLTQQIITMRFESVQALAWLVDCWECIAERFRRDSRKSALLQTVQKRETCERLWTYLTRDAVLLPLSVRSHVQHLVHSLYMQAYGNGVPFCFKDTLESPRDGKGPLSFWLPFKEHERIYRRFVLRGATVRPEKRAEMPKKPRLLITGAGTIPLDGGFSNKNSRPTLSQ